jgi:hypothetical protein
MYTKTWVKLFVECHVINSLLEVLRHGTCEGRIGGDVATLGADKKLLKLILLRSLVEDNILDGVVFRTLSTSPEIYYFSVELSAFYLRRPHKPLSFTLSTYLRWRASLDQLRAQCGTPGCVATSFTSARLIAETNGHLRF